MKTSLAQLLNLIHKPHHALSDQKSSTTTELEREDSEHRRILQRIEDEEKKLAKLRPRLETVRARRKSCLIFCRFVSKSRIAPKDSAGLFFSYPFPALPF